MFKTDLEKANAMKNKNEEKKIEDIKFQAMKETFKLIEQQIALNYSLSINQRNAIKDIDPYEFPESSAWKKVRYGYKKDHQNCEICLKAEVYSETGAVHHVVPYTRGGALFDKNNLMALCKGCHKDIHNIISTRYPIVTCFDYKYSEKWEDEVLPEYERQADEIEDKINRCKAIEKQDIDKAIKIYYEAIEQIQDWEKRVRNDAEAIEYARMLDTTVDKYTWHCCRYPINRLSYLLEKKKTYKESLSVIIFWEDLNDHLAISIPDKRSVEKRKVRLIQKIKNLQKD